ncbi:MAG: dimethylsulfonioproprionate lyase family protein [Planctomycetota bacterium]|nr:dimethylsulfonioproprionate lyase family protein [Planctomycetota bacterium]
MSYFLETEDLPWRQSPSDGVQWKKLRYDEESGLSTVLLQFEPGAAYAPHRHPEGEQYLVLSGSLTDGENTYGEGTYVYHPPGSVHAPRSAEGCLLFVTLPQPVELLEGDVSMGGSSAES